MELKIENGRYSAAAIGLEQVSGVNELAQRIAMKLTARKGAFWPCPEYGSRLYSLVGSEKISDRENAVRQYVAEAISDENDVTLEKVSITDKDRDSIFLRLDFVCGSSAFTVETPIA